MKACGLVVHGLLLIACVAGGTPAGAAAVVVPTPAKSKPAAADTLIPGGIRPEPAPRGGWLPDTTVMARVGPRELTAREFVDSYFDAFVEYRPAEDSLGRVQFLESQVNKDVMGLTALSINRPLDFEDRITLRETANRVYSNLLYQREVTDRVHVTDDQVRAAYEYFKTKLHARRILVYQRVTAEALRRDLMAGRIAWSAAVRKYSIAPDRDKDGDLGWSDPISLSMPVAIRTYPLRPGEVSEPIPQREGFLLMQVTERRTVEPPAWEGMQVLIRAQLTEVESARLADSLTAMMATEADLQVDSANVAWAAKQFGAVRTDATENGAPVLSIDPNVPEFSLADTARVLARFKGGQLSLGQFAHAYSDITPLMRPNVNDFGLMREQVISTALDPYMSQLAIRKGIDKDSIAVALVEKRREGLLVEHLYADSIESKIWIRPEERKQYYEENKKKYVTYVHVTYATVVRSSRAGIDSIVTRLKAGESARDIQLADSLVGLNMGTYAERLESEHGTPFYKVLFEELHPGEWAVDGPDKVGHFQVIQVIARQEPRQLSYQEAQGYVDESLHNMKAEARLKEFLARHKQNYKIESHPEWVMRVEFRAKD